MFLNDFGFWNFGLGIFDLRSLICVILYWKNLKNIHNTQYSILNTQYSILNTQYLILNT